jgi:hypothetical protein
MPVAGRPSIFVGPGDCEVGRIMQGGESVFVVETANEAMWKIMTSPPLRVETGVQRPGVLRTAFRPRSECLLHRRDSGGRRQRGQ